MIGAFQSRPDPQSPEVTNPWGRPGSTAVTGVTGVGEAALDPEWVALGTAAGAEVVGAPASLAAVTATTDTTTTAPIIGSSRGM